MRTKQEIQNELYELERQEEKKKEEERLQKNYEAFKERGTDWVIGRAHAEPHFKDNGWHHPKGQTMPQTVSIRGNMGHTYIPTASVTESTMTYFHNVWEHEDRASFERALEKLVQKEIERIAKKLHNVLEIMGLQSTGYHLRESYPKDKVKEIEEEIWNETIKILDAYSDEDFKKLYRERVYFTNGDDTPKSDITTELSHSNGILKRYLSEKRPHLTPPTTENI